MNIPPLCIIQARYNSTRLPGKVLLRLGDETLIERAWRIAREAFGDNVVVAIPAADEAGPLGDELRRIGAWTCDFSGDESDVLSRFAACAHTLRWHPDSVIVRYTPDDHRKSVVGLRRVAAGERLPVETGGEAFTLAMLDAADAHWVVQRSDRRNQESLRAFTEKVAHVREHISHALFKIPALPAPEGYTIDTQADYERAKAWVAENEPTFHSTHGTYTT